MTSEMLVNILFITLGLVTLLYSKAKRETIKCHMLLTTMLEHNKRLSSRIEESERVLKIVNDLREENRALRDKLKIKEM